MKTTSSSIPFRKCTLLLSILCASTSAYAEAQEKKYSRSSTLEEVMVTARKREESLQDSPVSVTALTSDKLGAASISSFNKLNGQIPNLELNNGRPDGGAGTAQIFIRGVGQEDSFFPNEPGVGVYVDGVYYARSSAGNTGLMNIDRIEVLRGPQGTLYGKNTIGGVLGILPPNTAKTVEGPVFTGLQATINFNLARVSVSSSAFGSKNEQNQATINSHCR